MTNKNQIKTPKLKLKRFRPSKLNKKKMEKSEQNGEKTCLSKPHISNI